MAAFGSGAVAAAREEGRSKIQRSRRTPRWLGARRWWMAACCASDGALPASRCQSHRRISAGREFPISASQARKINFSTSTKTIQEARSAVEYATPRPPHENPARKHGHFGLYSPLRKKYGKNMAKIRTVQYHVLYSTKADGNMGTAVLPMSKRTRAQRDRRGTSDEAVCVLAHAPGFESARATTAVPMRPLCPASAPKPPEPPDELERWKR